MSVGPHGLRCLIVDYGGVLTSPIHDTFSSWAAADGVEMPEFSAVMRELLADDAASSPVHGLERGEMSAAEFERQLARLLRRTDGSEVAPAGLLTKLFAELHMSPGMLTVVRRAREQGVRTGLLSNSWGLNYDRTGWDQLFDTVVISGEVGLRKPEPEIYRLAAERLGAQPAECVFVDDIAANVRGAAAVGMVGVHHSDLEFTISELETLFGIQLVDPD
jgi:epoxide hydrolase-like predicted phosphatase